MRLTKRKALEICRKLWEWLRKTGGDDDEKEDWPGWEKYGKMELDCPCCEYVGSYGRGDGCRKCPLAKLWPGAYGCLEPRSPFKRWGSAKTPRTRRKYAQKIVDGCNEALAKLPKQKRKVG